MSSAYGGIDDMDQAYFDAWKKQRANCPKCCAEKAAGAPYDGGPCRHEEDRERRKENARFRKEFSLAR